MSRCELVVEGERCLNEATHERTNLSYRIPALSKSAAPREQTVERELDLCDRCYRLLKVGTTDGVSFGPSL